MAATNNRNHGYRHPRTLQEEKANEELFNTGLVRGARYNIPDAYDDIRISKKASRGWNMRRKLRYKTGKDVKYSKHIVKICMKNLYRGNAELENIIDKIWDFCRKNKTYYLSKFKRESGQIEQTIEWFGPSFDKIIGPRHSNLNKLCIKWRVIQ